MQSANIFIHVLAGTIALIVGLVPYFSQKGGIRHRKFGKIFLKFFSITVFTAILGVLFFRSRPFLIVVTMLSFYGGWGGFRALQYKAKGPAWYDLSITLASGFLSIAFILGWLPGQVVWHSSVVYYLLIFLWLWCLYDVLRWMLWRRHRKLWLIEHVLKTTSAYMALFSAAMGTVFENWQPHSQIIPAILGTVLYVVIIVYFWQNGLSSSRPKPKLTKDLGK